MYTIQFYTNPYTYPDYGIITPVGSPIDVTGVDIDDGQGVFKTNALTYVQRFSVNYVGITRDGLTLYANIINIERVSGDLTVAVRFKVDAFRTFRSSTTFGTQMVVRQPGATFDLDPLLRGDSGETSIIETTRLNIDNPNQRVLIVQIMRPADDLLLSNTSPVQPSPYVIFFKQYNINNANADSDINALINTITNSARPSNLASIYSVPVFSAGGMSVFTGPIPLVIDGVVVNVGGGFLRFQGGDWSGVVRKLGPVFTFSDKDILRTKHSVSVVIPEAGILNVPDEILFKPGLRVRQDIDMYSGASNFMLVYDGVDATPNSIRGGGLSAIPIVYDVQQQNIASNRTSIIGAIASDVGAIGLGAMALAGAGATGGTSIPMGVAMAGKGALGIVSTLGSLGDQINQQVNPPAYLGSAMAANYGQSTFLVVTRARQDNATVVRSRYGYPVNQIKALTIPSAGYIQTQDCNVQGPIPQWAKEEINNLLNSGLRVI